MRIWTFEVHCCPSPLSGLSWRRQIGSERCGGPGSPPLWAGAWETSSTARPDTDWVWHCIQEARRGFSFALFPYKLKKKETPFCKKCPSSPLTPPGSVVLLALLLSLFLFSFLWLPHFFLFLFVFFILRLKPMDFCFFCLSLLCSSHLVVDQ